MSVGNSSPEILTSKSYEARLVAASPVLWMKSVPELDQVNSSTDEPHASFLFDADFLYESYIVIVSVENIRYK